MTSRSKEVLASAGVLFLTASYSTASDLVTWSENATKNFGAQQCLTIPGTPDVPGVCSPDVKVPYPCPTWNNPTKTCEQTIRGSCTPSIPGTPDVTECASVNLGAVSVQADGALATTGGTVQVHNTVHAQLFDIQTHFTVSCEINADTKFKACVNLLDPTTVEYSSNSATCNITDGLPSHATPIAANVCTFVEVRNITDGNPTGIVGAQVNVQAGYGERSVLGQTINLGSESWTQTLFNLGY